MNLLERNIENITAVLASFAKKSPYPHILLEDWHHRQRYHSSINFPPANGVLDGKYNPEDFTTAVETILADYGDKKNPFTWWWLDQAEPSSDVLSFMKEKAFHHDGNYLLIGKTLNNINKTSSNNPSCHIKKITCPEEYENFLDILTIGFGLDDALKKDFAFVLGDYQANEPNQHYIAYQQNKPVSVVTAYQHKNTVGLMNLATLPDTRKQGVATALVQQALHDAAASGYDFAVAQLTAEAMAKGLFDTLGFETHGRMIPFMWLG